MKPAPFAYHRPTSVAELLKLLGEHGAEGKILAGGQSLVAAMNFRLARPAVLIDINEIASLDYIRAEGDTLRIGALARHAAFHRPVVASPLGDLLSKVVDHVAHYPIRQRGTFAGSLAHADPASEWCLVATVLDAVLVLEGPGGTRTVPAADFFEGTFSTALAADELLAEIRLPLLGPGWHSGFAEFSRRAGDFALAMALAVLRIDRGVIAEARLGIGGISDKAVRLAALERQLVGKSMSAALFQTIGDQAAQAVTPSSDIHASADFRRELITTMVRRALLEAAAPEVATGAAA